MGPRDVRGPGLNMARQPDNGANPRPDNRSGWLEGESPQTPIDGWWTARPRPTSGIPPPSSATAPSARSHPAPMARPTAAAGTRVSSPPRSSPRSPGGPEGGVSDIEARLDDIRDSGLYRRMRVVSGPQGPSVLVDGRPVLLLCSNNYLGLADHPSVREAAAEAAMRYGAGAGASRLVSGNMTIHRRLEERLAEFKGPRLPAVRLRLPGERRHGVRARTRGRRGVLR